MELKKTDELQEFRDLAEKDSKDGRCLKYLSKKSRFILTRYPETILNPTLFWENLSWEQILV